MSDNRTEIQRGVETPGKALAEVRIYWRPGQKREALMNLARTVLDVVVDASKAPE